MSLSISYDTNLYKFIQQKSAATTHVALRPLKVCLSQTVWRMSQLTSIGLSTTVLVINVWSRGRSSCRSMSSATRLWQGAILVLFWWKGVMSHEIGNMIEIYDTVWDGWVRMVSHELHTWRGCVMSRLLSLMACHVVLSMVEFDQADSFCWIIGEDWLLFDVIIKISTSQWRSTHLIFEILMVLI